MMSFRGNYLANFRPPLATTWLLTDIAEAKGKQAGAVRLKPELLEGLRRTALIESAESSNRIEGVVVDAARLAPLVIGDARPRDRSEEEVQGYRRALTLIHEDAAKLPISSETVLRLHALAHEGSGDAGQWKARDNEILEYPADGGAPVVRFKPLSARETPGAMDELCRGYTHAVDQQKLQPLMAAGAFVLDFLCVHPFRDGNGRVARLLSLICLYHFGYDVGRYVSLERLIEEAREEYYTNLWKSSQGWHEGKHDLLPWLNYFLVIVKRAYQELGRRLESTGE